MKPLAIAATCVTVALMAGAILYGESVVQRQATNGRTVVIYWEKWTGDEAKEMEKVVNSFNKSQDRIFVRYLSISGVDQKTLLATSGGNPPDVAGIWQEGLARFSDMGALLDLTAMAKEKGLTRDYYIPAFYDALTYRGGLWALPSTPASIALHVNSDLVPKEVATPETFPKTIEELDKLSDKITKKDKDGNLTLSGFVPSNPGWWNWAWPIYFGGQIVKGDKITVDTPEAERSFKWVEGYYKRYGPTAVQNFRSGFANFASPDDPFMSGKVATEINGVWKANYIRVYKKGMHWFAVPFPYPADRKDLEGHSNLSQDVLSIPAGAKHPKEAFEFIAYVQQQKVMESLCKGHGKNSPLRVVSEEFFKTHQNKFIRLFDELARSPKAFSPPNIGIYAQIGNEINVAFDEVNTGQKTPKQALHDAQGRLDKLWATYQAQVLGVKK